MPIQPVSFDEADLRKILHPVPIDTLSRRRRRQFSAGLITLLILWEFIFVSSNFPAYWRRLQPLKPSDTQTLTPTNEQKKVTPRSETIEEKPTVQSPYAPTIISEKIALKAPIIFSVPESDVLNKLREGVVGLSGSALPSETGNVVLLGHSSNLAWRAGDYKTIFSLLDHLNAGDIITVLYQYDQYKYEVVEKRIVRPSDLSVLEKTSTPTLTLITCYPIGTANSRLVIRANLLSGTITGEQSTSPVVSSLPRAR